MTYAIGPKQYLAVQAGGRHLHPVNWDKLQNSQLPVRLRAELRPHAWSAHRHHRQFRSRAGKGTRPEEPESVRPRPARTSAANSRSKVFRSWPTPACRTSWKSTSCADTCRKRRRKPARSRSCTRSDSAEPTFTPDQASDERFELLPDFNPDWEASFYQSLATVDGVIILGGGPSALIAGLVAMGHKKPVVACAAFGGSGEKVWRALREQRYPLERNEFASMAVGAWSPEVAARLVSLLTRQRDGFARLAKEMADLEKRESTELRRKEYAENATINWHALVSAAPVHRAAASWPFAAYQKTASLTNVLVLVLLTPMVAGASGSTIRVVLDWAGGVDRTFALSDVQPLHPAPVRLSGHRCGRARRRLVRAGSALRDRADRPVGSGYRPQAADPVPHDHRVRGRTGRRGGADQHPQDGNADRRDSQGEKQPKRQGISYRREKDAYDITHRLCRTDRVRRGRSRRRPEPVVGFPARQQPAGLAEPGLAGRPGQMQDEAAAVWHSGLDRAAAGHTARGTAAAAVDRDPRA